MTIIIGAITKKFGIVGSDSRIFEPAELKEGKVIKEAVPKKGDFDKTFIAKGGKLIGAVAGLMEISKKDIKDHIVDLINEVDIKTTNLDLLIEQIAAKLKDKLEKIDEKEVIFTERILHVIVIGSTNYDERDFSIFTLSFFPSGTTKEIQSKIDKGSSKSLSDYQIYKSIRGEDEAVEASKNRIDFLMKKKQVLPYGLVKNFVESALNLGINKSGNHKYGREKSCGGNINIKKVSKFYS